MKENQKIDQFIPVVDIFAGPGGLSEGFSAFKSTDSYNPFNVKLSIEKEPVAYQTLLLRAFYRQFSKESVPTGYYELLRNISEPLDKRQKVLFDKYPVEAAKAKEEARQATLGEEKAENIRQWIDNSLVDSQHWVLIGGPPCQAYSLAGRSRNKRIGDYVIKTDT